MGIGRNKTWGSKYSNANFQKRWLQKKENCCDPLIIPPPPLPLGLVMTFGDVNLIPFDPTIVANWNTFMYASGTPFTNVAVQGNMVVLTGYLNTGLQPAAFQFDTNLISMVDQTDEIIATGNQFFYQSQVNSFVLDGLIIVPTEICYQCFSLTSISIDSATSIQASAFQESNLITVDAPNCLSVGTMAFKDAANLQSADFPVCVSVGMMGFHITTAMVDANFPNLTTIGDYGFESANLSGTIDFNKITSIGQDAFDSSQLTGSFVFPLLTNAAIGGTFQSCPNITSLECPVLTAVPTGFVENSGALQTLKTPLAGTVGDTACGQCLSLTYVDFTSCISLGTTVGNDSVFDGITLNNVTIFIDVSRATCNAGGPDGDLAALAANNTVIVNYTNFDVDAQAFFDADGTFPNTINTIKVPVNTWFVSAKANGYYSKYIFVYLFVGGTAYSHKWNVINPVDSILAFRMAFLFNGGGMITHDSLGVHFNGIINCYATTFMVPSTHMNQDNKGYSIYLRTNGGVCNFGSVIGTLVGDQLFSNYFSIPSGGDGNNYFSLSAPFSSILGPAISNGFWNIERESNVLAKEFRNNVLFNTNVTPTTTNSNHPVFLAARNQNGAQAAFSADNTSFFAAKNSFFTPAERAAEYADVLALQTSLGRNV